MAVTIPNDFGDEMWDIFPEVFKKQLEVTVEEDRVIWNLLQVLGKQLQVFQEEVQKYGRRESFVKTAGIVATDIEDGLLALGEERNLAKRTGETREEYRTRLLAAFQYWSSGGLLKGIKDAIVALGFDNVVFTERVGGDSSVFDVTVLVPPADPAPSAEMEAIIEETIEEIRPAHKQLGTFTIGKAAAFQADAFQNDAFQVV